MSRTLASALVFFGCVAAASGQPSNPPVGKADLPDVQKAQARILELKRLEAAQVVQVEQKRAAQAVFVVNGVIVQQGQAWSDEQIEQWVFQTYGNASGAHRQLESQLATQIVDINRICRLTNAQKEKLQLAGRGDIKRFFDRYEGIKRKAQLIPHDELALQKIWQDIRPLQTTLQSGLFHEESLLTKSLPNTLTDEQFARYDTMVRERRAARHRENINRAVAILQRGIRLRDPQRRELVSLIRSQTRPSPRSGPYEISVLLWQLGRLPNEKLKQLFDPEQWDIVSQQLAGYGQLEPMLKQAGLLPAEGDGADRSDEDRQP